MLNSAEKERYDRHLTLPEFGEKAQLKLKNAKVLVVGAGGLGSPILLYLAAVGVGYIGIIDGDVVDVSNLQRQVLFNTSDIGINKAEVAAIRLQLQNNLIKIKYYPFLLTNNNALDLFSEYDVIVDGTDNFATRYLCNDAAVITKKPLIHGSIFKFEGQVSVFNYQNGPTYRCLFPEPPSLGSVPSCSEIGVLGVLPGIIGSYQALETIKIITGVGEPLSGKLLCINTLNNSQQVLEFEKDLEHSKVDQLLDNYEYFCGFNALVKEISYTAAKLLLDAPDYQLIDVREITEYENYNIGGLNLPLSTWDFELSNQSKTPIFICQKGIRSKNAAQQFSEHLNQHSYSIVGGIEDLKKN